jgi:hypothetical protein
MVKPLFIATERFDPSDGEKWEKYCKWAEIPGITEIVSLDTLLCPHLINEFNGEDWSHIVNEDFRLNYFYDLEYLLRRVAEVRRKNVLGLYRNPANHIQAPPASGNFAFIGYDLIEEQTQISALNNCGGFPESFSNSELNQFGIISNFDRAAKVRVALAENNPNECHAHCELYAIWRMNIGVQPGSATDFSVNNEN